MTYKIGVITNSTTGQSLKDLQHSAQKFAVDFDLVPAPIINLSEFTTSNFFKRLLKYDVLYYRTGLRDIVLETLTYHLNQLGKPLVNGSLINNSHRKIQQALVANKYNIRQPKSIYMNKPEFQTLANNLLVPFVAKPDLGSQGNDITLIHKADELTGLITKTNRDRWLFQEYITGATEYRVYTLGTKYITSYKKNLNAGDFRANLHAGGSIINTESNYVSLLINFSEKIAEAFQADIAGIDIFIKDHQCYFIELNWQPGWELVDKLTSIDFGDETIKYILSKIKSL